MSVAKLPAEIFLILLSVSGKRQHTVITADQESINLRVLNTDDKNQLAD